jgi:hypothetical protein
MNVPTKSLAVRLRSMCKFFKYLHIKILYYQNCEEDPVVDFSEPPVKFSVLSLALSQLVAYEGAIAGVKNTFNKTRFDDPPPDNRWGWCGCRGVG